MQTPGLILYYMQFSRREMKRHQTGILIILSIFVRVSICFLVETRDICYTNRYDVGVKRVFRNSLTSYIVP